MTAVIYQGVDSVRDASAAVVLGLAELVRDKAIAEVLPRSSTCPPPPLPRCASAITHLVLS